MNDALTIAACGATGGVVGGYIVSLLKPSGQRRGQHRHPWQKAPPGSEDATVETPLPTTDPDAPTVQMPGGGALVSEGETSC